MVQRAKKDKELIGKLEDLQQIQGKFLDLHLNVLNSENTINEVRTNVLEHTEKIKKLEGACETSEKLGEYLEGKKEMDSKELSQCIIGLTKGFKVSMVHKDEFMDMRAESGLMQRQLNELKIFRETIEQRSHNDHYTIIKNTHTTQENQLSLENLQL